MGIDRKLLDDPQRRKRMLALVGILRLADQRRSGSRLLTMDQCAVHVIERTDGFLQAICVREGMTHRPDVSISNQIILSEKLNEFGPVTLSRRGSVWTMAHTLYYSRLDHEEARRLLIHRRIPSYVTEISDSLLKAGAGMRHTLLICASEKHAEASGSRAIRVSAEDLMSLGSGRASFFEGLRSSEIEYMISESLKKFSGGLLEMIE